MGRLMSFSSPLCTLRACCYATLRLFLLEEMLLQLQERRFNATKFNFWGYKYSQSLSGSLWVQSWKGSVEEIVHLVSLWSGFDPIKVCFIYLLGAEFPSPQADSWLKVWPSQNPASQLMHRANVVATCIQVLQNLATLTVHIIPNGFGLKLNVNDGL